MDGLLSSSSRVASYCNVSNLEESSPVTPDLQLRGADPEPPTATTDSQICTDSQEWFPWSSSCTGTIVKVDKTG